MLFKISNSFFCTKKVAYFVQKQVILIRSNPTYLRCIADQTRSKYDQPTVYRRSTYDLWRAGSSPTIFQPVEKIILLTTTSQSGPDQPGESGGWSALWCERAFRSRRYWISKIQVVRPGFERRTLALQAKNLTSRPPPLPTKSSKQRTK